MADPLKERISLLTMGEAQGKLKPEHIAELENYRRQGLAKPSAATVAASADSGGALETSKGRDDARKAIKTIELLQPQIARVRELQRKTLGATGLRALGEFNPFSEDNQQYDSAVAQLTSVARPATRTPGEGSMSDFETKLATATLPNRWKRDKYNEEALNGLQRLVDTSRTLYSRQLGLPVAPPSTPKPASSAGWKITRKN
ncbi:hypothetical protein [Sphingomonas sp. BK580]|uniref:hypothetical protein n=1 Tax=Sphingomonas sp. BK580 TaxID=2586972 RepID=UPI0016161842|nr:hypothetical protein [Sphingomonas sp. BK580]MBB3693011.1 hypothetical protein [Sphingomonas sp. BK580]